LKINIGDHNVEKNDFQAILSFLKNLQNIQSLKLESLVIPTKKDFVDLVDASLGMRSLRTLVLGPIDKTVTKPIFISSLNGILRIKGLEKFDCRFDWAMKNKWENREYQKILLIEIKKINPLLRMYWQFCEFIKIDNDSYAW